MARYYTSTDGKEILRIDLGAVTHFKETVMDEEDVAVMVPLVRNEITPEKKAMKTLKVKSEGKKLCICSLCGEAGHRKTTCPKNRGGKIDGFLPPDIVETIHALKEEGMTSEQVAGELDLSIAAVNRYWVKKEGEKNPNNHKQ